MLKNAAGPRRKEKKLAEAESIIANKAKVAEAESIIANNKAKATTAAPEPAPTTGDESPKCNGEKNSSLSTQWLAVGSLIVSLVGLYYKREELKAFYNKKVAPKHAPQQPAPAEPEPATVAQPKKGG